ncbi:MAG: EAL domain-containing protein [Lachnospiraceae bacterium]|nr:EAL domain-containing protein [Lachnospiraceae bacterium]
MEKRVSNFTAEQENSVLRLISGVNFDYTFLLDVESGKAYVTRYADCKIAEQYFVDDFVDFIVSRVHPDDYSQLEKEVKKMSQLVPSMGFEVRLKEVNGRRYRWHLIKLHVAEQDGKLYYAGSSTFIDSRKKNESELTIKARQDQLTGLLNKVVTQESIAGYIRKNPNTEGALIVFDIDNFKNYNDFMGHLFGDEVLKDVATRMRRLFAKDSIIGRIGGDEFLVYVKEYSDVTEIVKRLNELRTEISDISLGQKSHYRISLSIGVSLYPDMGTDFDTLFKAADMALYSIKNRGKNSYAFYTDELYNEECARHGEERLQEATVEHTTPISLTDFAFKILHESQNVSAATNLLLYKIRNEYDFEAIHIYELSNEKAYSTEVTYEIHKEGRESRLGKKVDFSRTDLKEHSEMMKKEGYILYDFTKEEKPHPGNGIEEWEGIGSMLHVDMGLFSQTRGCIDFISAKPPVSWSKQQIDELLSISNLLAVCLYYTDKVTKAEKAVSRYEEFDYLTGLLKEENFIEAAQKAIAETEDDIKIAVVCSDIRNFKYINETFGYTTGDRVIRAMAEYIGSRERDMCCATRLRGDHILRVQKFPASVSDENIGRLIEDSCEKMTDYIAKKTGINNIFIRAGVYIAPAEDYDLDGAISNSNTARKNAIGSTGSHCQIFDRELFETKRRYRSYRQGLEKALANKEFYVLMQPEVSATDHKLVGAEALIRWRMEDGTEVTPDEFIPAFETDGSMIKLDFYAYELVMTYLRSRIEAGKRIVPISLNVSKSHFLTRDFVLKFKELVRKYDIPTEYLKLEITESMRIDNQQNFTKAVEELRDFGISVSLDDFGKGYSTLSALNDLNVDLLKIDRAFMKDTTLKESDKTILRFIIDMARSLRIKVLCQGVESDDQRSFLNEAGCGLQQGFLYSRPVSLASFNEVIDNEDILFQKIS